MVGQLPKYFFRDWSGPDNQQQEPHCSVISSKVPATIKSHSPHWKLLTALQPYLVLRILGSTNKDQHFLSKGSLERNSVGMQSHHWLFPGIPKPSGSKLKTTGRDKSLRQDYRKNSQHQGNVVICIKIKNTYFL